MTKSCRVRSLAVRRPLEGTPGFRVQCRGAPSRVGVPMPYTDFTLESAEARFRIVTVPGDLFPGLTALPVPEWLRDLLARGQAVAALVSEKARSEFLVTPVLLACRDLVSGDLSIYSGQRLDVDADLGLTGECDYILALTPPVPRLRARGSRCWKRSAATSSWGWGRAWRRWWGRGCLTSTRVARWGLSTGWSRREKCGSSCAGRGCRDSAPRAAVHRRPGRRSGGVAVHSHGQYVPPLTPANKSLEHTGATRSFVPHAFTGVWGCGME